VAKIFPVVRLSEVEAPQSISTSLNVTEKFVKIREIRGEKKSSVINVTVGF